MESDEVRAMAACVEALQPLTREEQRRAAEYLFDRFHTHPSPLDEQQEEPSNDPSYLPPPETDEQF